MKMNIDTLLKHLQNPIWFGENVLGVSYWAKQKEIIESVWKNKRTTVKATHSVGKTRVSGCIVPTFLGTHPKSIVITTAPTTRQVEQLLWKEIRSVLNGRKMEIGFELTPSTPYLKMTQKGVLDPDWYGIGFSTNDPDKFQGYHAKSGNLLVIVDEASGVDDRIFSSIEGLLTGDKTRLLLIGNPTSVNGGFYESFKDPNFNKITISSYDSPNFSRMGITKKDIYNGDWKEKNDRYIYRYGTVPFPFLITPEAVAQMYAKWCKGGILSPLFITKVEGEFVEQNEDSLIPVSWVELAFERWKEGEKKLKGDVEIGVDVAEFGDDESCIAIRIGNTIKEIKRYKELAVMDLAGIVAGTCRREDIDALIKVDTIGIGTGVEGRLKEEGFNTLRVAVSQGANFIDKTDPKIMKIKDDLTKELISDGESFANLKAQMYWNLRMRLDPDKTLNPNPIALPPDENLIQELTSIRYSYTSKGKIQMEAKKDTKRRIGRSPDMADAVAIAFCPRELVEKTKKAEPRIWTINL